MDRNQILSDVSKGRRNSELGALIHSLHRELSRIFTIEGKEDLRFSYEKALEGLRDIRYRCIDCGKIPNNEEFDYRVKRDVWDSVVASKDLSLCKGCLEKRLGRPLTNLDLKDFEVDS